MISSALFYPVFHFYPLFPFPFPSSIPYLSYPYHILPNQSPRNAYHTLFVARISFDTTEKKLRREFEQYGPVRTVKMITDKNDKARYTFSFLLILPYLLPYLLHYPHPPNFLPPPPPPPSLTLTLILVLTLFFLLLLLHLHHSLLFFLILTLLLHSFSQSHSHFYFYSLPPPHSHSLAHAGAMHS
jgi:RNA recognition motif. (a.k.a. RRM, RBD, or RNP domain)